jgi:DNA/RNA endonuclease YhcR with UshA esterase domain
MRSLFIISILFLSFNAFSQETITASQAKDFVGKEVFLTGKVAGSKLLSTKAGEPMLLVDIDNRYPENDVKVVIYSEIISKGKFTEESLKGKQIQVKGVVSIFKEKPQIILENEANLTIQQ